MRNSIEINSNQTSIFRPKRWEIISPDIKTVQTTAKPWNEGNRPAGLDYMSGGSDDGNNPFISNVMNYELKDR
jgi:hypothetical protein